MVSDGNGRAAIEQPSTRPTGQQPVHPFDAWFGPSPGIIPSITYSHVPHVLAIHHVLLPLHPFFPLSLPRLLIAHLSSNHPFFFSPDRSNRARRETLDRRVVEFNGPTASTTPTTVSNGSNEDSQRGYARGFGRRAERGITDSQKPPSRTYSSGVRVRY